MISCFVLMLKTYWNRSSALPLVEVEHNPWVTAWDLDTKIATVFLYNYECNIYHFYDFDNA